MKVEYSIWKIYIAVMLPIGALVLSVLWRFPNIIIAFFFVLGGVMSFPCTFIFTQVFNFEIDEQGFHRKWMGTTEQRVAWADLKLRKIPLTGGHYWISIKGFFWRFPSLPTLLMKDSKGFRSYIK